MQYWSGSAWATVPGGSVTGNNKVWRQFNFSPITTTKIRVVVNAGADNAFSRLVEVEAWTVPATNYARATNGGSATGSSTLSPYVAANVIDGSRRAINNTVWLDNTFNSFPDWLEISFNGSKSISEIDVITQQDDPQNPVEPSLSQTFSLYGITAFDVQYWNGSAWATVPGGSVTGNNKVWRQFNFSPITTTKIRVVVNGGVDNAFSRLVEVEAWGHASTETSSNIHWLVTDHLGTPRMIIDQTGTLANVKRHDYLPFGEELFAPTGGRTAALGYSGGDGVRQQFTGKERDIETGLDYFLARYYTSVQGRFISPDEFSGGPTELFIAVAPHNPTFYADLAEPQSLNKYQYCLNNPLRYFDFDGHQTATADDVMNAYSGGTVRIVQGAVVHTAVTFGQDGWLRKGYQSAAAALPRGPFRTEQRIALQQETRQKMTALGREVSKLAAENRKEQLALKTAVQLEESAGRTSPFWNKIGLASERAAPVLTGVGLGISAYNICTAEKGERGEVVASEVGAWTGAILGGKGGAEVGAFVGSVAAPGPGSVIGAVAGGLVGGAGGAVAGSDAGRGIYNSINSLSFEQKRMLLERH